MSPAIPPGRRVGRPGGARDGRQRQGRDGGRREFSGRAPAAGYDLLFLMAAGLGLAIAVVSVLLPRHRRADRRRRRVLTRRIPVSAYDSRGGAFELSLGLARAGSLGNRIADARLLGR
jgi:hypothetical protein